MTNKRISFQFRAGALSAASLFLAFALAPGAAHAEPVQKPDTADTRGADADAVQEHMRTGVAAYKSGDLEAAHAAFLKAWAIKPHYAIAASLAEVEMALGQYRRTAEHLEYYLSNLPAELEDKRGEAQNRLTDAKKHLAILRVTVNAPEATIYLDGVEMPANQRELLVDPGAHVLKAEHGGISSRPSTLECAAGDSRDVLLEIQEHNSVPTAVRSSVTPSSTAATSSDVTSHRPTAVLLVGGGLTLVALGITVGYVVDAASAKSDADQLRDETRRTGDPALVSQSSQCSPPVGMSAPATCGPLQDSVEHQSRSYRIANGALLATGILAVGTIATYFLWPNTAAKQERTGVRVAPWIGRDTGGAFVAGKF